MANSTFDYLDPCSELSDEEYLQLFKLSEKKYVIGTFQEGITVYKQQVRALNIFNALINTKKIPTDSNYKFTIVIVGGGMAGMTFATAALKSNVRVIIVEKFSHYLDMQRGCTIRKLHPHLYDWPIQGSTNIHAKLPVLSWKSDTAANVVNQIEYGFRQVIKDVRKPNLPPRFIEHFDVEGLKMVPENLEDTELIHVTGSSPKFNFNYYANMVIYSVGFGLELGIHTKHSTPSYWRNESFHQSFLDTNKTKFHVVGTGDGALIDLCRLLIKDFSYDLLFKIFHENPHQKELESDLLEIKQKMYEADAKTTLDHEFSKIEKKKYDHIYKYLFKNDLLRGYEVELIGRKDDFSNILDLNRISMLNAFIAYILLQNRRFTYFNRKIEIDSGNYTIDGKAVPDTSLIIDRRGTERKSAYKSAALSPDELKNLDVIEKNQKEIKNNGTVKPRWSYTDFYRHFDPTLNNDIEYFTVDTRAICSGYVSILYQILQNFHNRRNDFRIALYRVMDSSQGMRFQQITSYFGSKDYNVNGGVGHSFDVKRGNIGLSILSGKPILIRRREEACFDKVLSELDILPEKEKLDGLNSFLTLPILSTGQGIATNLVLAIDSNDVNFFGTEGLDDVFEKNPILDTIISSTRGFIDNINHLLKHHQIHMEQLTFSTLKIDLEKELSSSDNCLLDLSTVYPELTPGNEPLHFSEFNSFDIIYGNTFSFN